MSMVPSRSEALSRHRKEMLRRRQLAKMIPSGGLSGRSGIVAPVQQIGVEQQTVNFDGADESIPVDQPGPTTAAISNKYPIRSGGNVTATITFITPLSAAGEIQIFKNGVVVATAAVATGTTLQKLGPWTGAYFKTNDVIQLAISNAGSGGDGFHAELRFS